MLSTVLANSWSLLSPEQRAALASWLNAYASLLASLGTSQLAVLSSETSAQQLAAWIDEAERARATVNGPTAEQLYQSRAGAPGWPVLLAAWESREPRIAQALSEMEQSYIALREAGGPVASLVSDEALRAWAWDRVAREAGTGAGAGNVRPGVRARRGSGLEVIFLLVGVWFLFGNGGRRG